MKRNYKQGIDRQQGMLLPIRVEEYISEDNTVRAVDVYVDSLDLEQLGFINAAGGLTAGQPAYPPGGLLKLYLYGFMQGIRSSRKLAKECQRNLEVIWLMTGLQPSYKTIADFRKNNLTGIKAVNLDFVQLCQELKLFGNELVALDGSYFRGNVGKKSIYSEERLQKTLSRLEKHIAAYLTEMEQLDTVEADQADPPQRFTEKLEQLRKRQQAHQTRLTQLQASGQKQWAEVDPDARLLAKNGQSVAGYNVQTAVDAKHKLLVTCEVTQDGNDTQQLAPMAKQAQQTLGVSTLEAVADAGYFNFAHIKACQDAGITPYLPEPNKKAKNANQGKYTRDDFQYHAETDTYRCPANQTLIRYSQNVQRGKLYWAYRSLPPVCADCSLKSSCLPVTKKFRSLYRWEHEAEIEVYRQRMTEQGPAKMALRACLAEHPFGTLKRWCGWNHFLLRGLQKVCAELQLWMLGYNFKRVLNILGLNTFREYCLQRAA